MSTEPTNKSSDMPTQTKKEDDFTVPHDISALNNYLVEESKKSSAGDSGVSSLALNDYMDKVQKSILPLRLEFNLLLKQLAHLGEPNSTNEKKFLDLRARLASIIEQIHTLSVSFQKLQPLLRILRDNKDVLEKPNSFYVLETLENLPFPPLAVPLPKQFQPKFSSVSAATAVASSGNKNHIRSPSVSVNSPMTPVGARTPGTAASQNTAKHNLTSAPTAAKSKGTSTSSANLNNGGSVKKPSVAAVKRGTPQSISPLTSNTPIVGSNSLNNANTGNDNLIASTNNMASSNIGNSKKNYGASANPLSMHNATPSQLPNTNDNPLMYMNTGSIDNLTPGNILQGLNGGNSGRASYASTQSGSVATNNPPGNNITSNNKSTNQNPNVNMSNNNSTNFAYSNFSMSPSSILQNINQSPVPSTNNNNNNNTNNNNNSTNSGMLDINSLDLSNLDDFLQ